MRYIFIILSLVGTMFLITSYKPSLFSMVAFTVPVGNPGFGITWAVLLLTGIAIAGMAKLKFGK